MKNDILEQINKETADLMNKLTKWGCLGSLSEMEASDIEQDIKRIAANALLGYQNTMYNATQDIYKQVMKR